VGLHDALRRENAVGHLDALALQKVTGIDRERFCGLTVKSPSAISTTDGTSASAPCRRQDDHSDRSAWSLPSPVEADPEQRSNMLHQMPVQHRYDNDRSRLQACQGRSRDIMNWWEGQSEERYWCEVTDRDDIGADLRCPQTNETGGSFWGYDLIREIQPGDLVFHYREESVVGCSIARGPLREELIPWRAQGSFARARPGPAEPRPGWVLPLDSYTTARKSLEEIREDEPWVLSVLESIKSQSKKIPWLFQAGQLRGMQTYVAKLPAVFVARWEVLAQVATHLGVPPPAELTDAPSSDLTALWRIVAAQRRRRRAGRMIAPPQARIHPPRTSVTTAQWRRLASVVEHVLARAGGNCEACGAASPFLDMDNEPFFEVHHVRTLAEGGPDCVENAVALCPNCHRALHHAHDRENRRELLYQRVTALRRC
jgi:hypothetical protein